MNLHKFPKQHYGNDSDDAENDGCGEISLFERPSWSQSLQRLRWCCPGVPNFQKVVVERRTRTQSDSTATSKTSSPQASSPQLLASATSPPYQWDLPPQMQMQYPTAPQGWYPPPPPGYSPQYYPPNSYAAWAYPPMNFNLPPVQQQNGMVYSSPSSGSFLGKMHGLNRYDPSLQTRKNTPVEQYPVAAVYDSGTESEISRKSVHRRQTSVSSKQRQVVKPPLVQRRATAPVQSSKEQSAAHPPLHPNHSSHKNVIAARPRLPSEMSRTSVGTASSRHRRQVHETFEFSTHSLREIAREGPVPVGPPPMHFIEVQPLQRSCSWSSWDDQTHHEDDNSLLLSPDEDEIAGYVSPADEAAAGKSPVKLSPLRRKDETPPPDWMVQWAQQEGKTTIEPPASPVSRSSITSRISDPPPVPTKDTATGPVYLPVSLDLDKQVQGAGASIVFSGWAAISEGDSMRGNFALAEDNEIPIEHEDICYLQLVREGSQCSLKIHRPSREVKDVTLSRSLQVLSQEVSGRAGRCVLLQDGWTRQVLWTILPVSLSSHFFRQGRLVSARSFALLQSAMFTPFYNATTGSTSQEWSQEYCMRRYAPDAQHDAAMHILFAMDGALSSTIPEP